MINVIPQMYKLFFNSQQYEYYILPKYFHKNTNNICQ